MKALIKFLFLFLFISFPLIKIHGQISFNTEAEYRTYILNNLDAYDPIVGVYSITGYVEKYVENRYIDTTPLEIMEKMVIVRNGDHFESISLPPNGTYSSIYPTTKVGKYIRDGKQIQLDNEMSFTDCHYETNENVAKVMSISERNVRNYGVKINVCTKFTKIFPTQYDIERYIKTQQEQAAKIKNTTGTGFLISNEGIIVTNYHVVENAKSITIRGVNGVFNEKSEADVIYSDKANDLALLKLKKSNLNLNTKIPYFFKSNISEVGEAVFVLGYPLTATMGDEVKLTDGIISSRSGFQGDISTYQITAPIQPGNSGAPLFDKKGNLIGIVNAKHKNTDNVGYAIKLIYLDNIIQSIPIKASKPIKNEFNLTGLPDMVKTFKNYIYIIEVELN
jgi:S1-C subfamily serine protease